MAVTVADINKRQQDEIIPVIQDNRARIEKLEPLVVKHELILFGKQDDFRDQGMVGVLNDVAELVAAVKSWGKSIGLAIILSLIAFVAKNLFDMYLTYQALQQLR